MPISRSAKKSATGDENPLSTLPPSMTASWPTTTASDGLVYTATLRRTQSTIQTICVPAAKYSMRFRANSAFVFPGLNTSTTKSGARVGQASAGNLPPGRLLRSTNATSGPRKTDASRKNPSGPDNNPNLPLATKIPTIRAMVSAIHRCFVTHRFLHQRTIDPFVQPFGVLFLTRYILQRLPYQEPVACANAICAISPS